MSYQKKVVKFAEIVEEFLLSVSDNGLNYSRSDLLNCFAATVWVELGYINSSRENKLTLLDKALKHIQEKRGDQLVSIKRQGIWLHRMEKSTVGKNGEDLKAALCDFVQENNTTLQQVKDVATVLALESKHKEYDKAKALHESRIYQLPFGVKSNYIALVSTKKGAPIVSFVKKECIPHYVDSPTRNLLPPVSSIGDIFYTQMQFEKILVLTLSCTGKKISVIRVDIANPDILPTVHEV